MRERLTARQEMYIKEWAKTLGEAVLVKPEDMARLVHKADFKTNIPRLHNKIMRQSIQGLSDLDYMIRNLPASYKARILQSDQYKNFSKRLLREERELAKAQRGELNVAIQDMYQSIARVKSGLPADLDPLLITQLELFLSTVQTLANHQLRSEGRPLLSNAEGDELLQPRGISSTSKE